jgi:hypothetical protein
MTTAQHTLYFSINNSKERKHPPTTQHAESSDPSEEVTTFVLFSKERRSTARLFVDRLGKHLDLRDLQSCGPYKETTHRSTSEEQAKHHGRQIVAQITVDLPAGRDF